MPAVDEAHGRPGLLELGAMGDSNPAHFSAPMPIWDIVAPLQRVIDHAHWELDIIYGRVPYI